MYAIFCKKDEGKNVCICAYSSQEKLKKDKIETKTVDYLQNGDEKVLQDMSK